MQFGYEGVGDGKKEVDAKSGERKKVSSCGRQTKVKNMT